MNGHHERVKTYESLSLAIARYDDPCDRHLSPIYEYRLLQTAHSLGQSAAILKMRLTGAFLISNLAERLSAVRQVFSDLENRCL